MTQELVAALAGEGVVLQLNGVEFSYTDNVRRRGADAIFDMYTSVTRQAQRRTMLTEAEIRSSVGLSRGVRLDGLWAANGFVARIAQDEFTKLGMNAIPSVGTSDAGLARLNQQRGYNVGLVRIPASMGAQAVQVALAVLSGQSVPKATEITIQVIPARAVDISNLNVPDAAPLGDEEGLPEAFRPLP
jgi:ribose transport system substrate-binding protein